MLSVNEVDQEAFYVLGSCSWKLLNVSHVPGIFTVGFVKGNTYVIGFKTDSFHYDYCWRWVLFFQFLSPLPYLIEHFFWRRLFQLAERDWHQFITECRKIRDDGVLSDSAFLLQFVPCSRDCGLRNANASSSSLSLSRLFLTNSVISFNSTSFKTDHR